MKYIKKRWGWGDDMDTFILDHTRIFAQFMPHLYDLFLESLSEFH